MSVRKDKIGQRPTQIIPPVPRGAGRSRAATDVGRFASGSVKQLDPVEFARAMAAPTAVEATALTPARSVGSNTLPDGLPDSAPPIPPFTPLTLKAWPRLIEALRQPNLAILGDTPEEVAKYLVIRGLDDRLREDAANSRARNAAAAAGKGIW
jgi:hypothetical protein